MTDPVAKGLRPIALVDLDGTLADFEAAMRRELDAIATPGEQAFYTEQKDEPAYITARRRLIKAKPGFWRTLPKFQLGFDVLHVLTELRFEIVVCSRAPRKNSNAWKEKVEWCDEHLRPETPIAIQPDKSLVYGKVLLDDWLPYVEPWLRARPRGLAVLPAHDYNKDFSHPNAIRYDGTNLDQVRERLIQVRATVGD